MEKEKTIKEFSYLGYTMRPHMRACLDRYIETGLLPGHFLKAVICNDLFDAVGRADMDNLKNLSAFITYLYNEAPSECWGSKEAMFKWSERKKREEAKA
ncbi:hypothetical protein IIA15_00330 [candidate division TA06 bacterium]|nr:hypothetical protein [candidate division TA06 bacterium]